MIAASLEAAEADLAQFDSDNPSEQYLMEQERLRVQAEQNAATKQRKDAWRENRRAALAKAEDILKLDIEAKTIGLGGMQEAECSNTFVMLNRLCTNRGCEPASALSSMRAILEKL
jgi:hypothetical protein